MRKKLPLFRLNKTITIGGQVIFFTLRSSARARRIALRISKEHRMEVVVPYFVSIDEGLRFIESQRPWIEKHLHLLTPGEPKYLYLGRELKLIHTHSRQDGRHKIFIEDDLLNIESPFQSTSPAKEIFMHYLHGLGKRYLTGRCAELAKAHGFQVTRISIRGQKSRWGSCSRRGTISLNYKLMQFRQELIDYVIIHELCHLRHMNHSDGFWAEVERIIPDYRLLDKEINKFRN